MINELDYFTLLNENDKVNVNENKKEMDQNVNFSLENFNSYKDNFNWKKYIISNNDLKNIHSKQDAINHWLNFGIKENRILYLYNNNKEEDKYIDFDWKQYKNYYKDLKNIHSKEEAINHWLNFGKKENRTFFTINKQEFSPNSSFNKKSELKSQEDFSYKEEIDFNNFDWKTYINNYDDLKDFDSKKKAWDHWIKNGKKEKRVLFDIHKQIEENYIELKNNELLKGKEIILFEKKLIFKSYYNNYGKHYFGWKGVISSLLDYIQSISQTKNLLLKEKIFFDEWIEKLLLWGNKIKNNEFLKEIHDNHYKLITFIHNPPYENYYSLNSLEKQNLDSKVLFNEDLLNNNLFKCIENQNNNFKDKLMYIYTLSISHKEWIYHHYPDYRQKIISIYHPININNKDIKFNYNNFKINKRIFHIGWWLRNFKTFIDFSFPFDFSKNILIKKDFEKQWMNLNVNFNLKNINIVYELNNDEYEKVFQNSCIFLDLEDAVANNVILECIKFSTPILVKKNESTMEYLGKNYPFYFNSSKDLKKMEDYTSEEWLNKILYTHKYLLNLNKDHLLLDTFNKKIYYDIEKLSHTPIKFKLTWIIIINKIKDVNKIENIIKQFLNQLLLEKVYLLFLIENTLINSYNTNSFSYTNISFKPFKKEKNFNIELNNIILSLESDYITFPQVNNINKKEFSQSFIKYLDENPTCDIGFSSFSFYFTSQEKIIHKIFEKDFFFFKKNIISLHEENLIIPLVFRKNIINLFPFENTGIEFLEKCFHHHLNIKCVSKDELCKIYELI
jgi:hypothetical protein